MDGPKLLVVIGVVVVHVVEDAEWAVAFGRLRVITTALHLRLGREHRRTLALHVVRLGLLVFQVGLWELEEQEVAFFYPRAPGRHIEHL